MRPSVVPKITYDAAGTPGIWAEDALSAYWGIGLLHGRHRGLQALVLATAARGRLAELLIGRDELVRIDALVHRLDLIGQATREAERLPVAAAGWVDAYLDGLRTGLRERGQPFELTLLLTRLPPPDRVTLLAGMLLSSYLGLAEGQERMEHALVDALRAGADIALLRTMFAPHLSGFDPQTTRRVPPHAPLGLAANGLAGAGGSNAWAVTPARSASGASILCGDPHLQIDLLPGLFFEIRACVGEDFWLGATIPGLPGLAVGRNRHLAWSGTFGVADNVDFVIEELRGGRAQRGQGVSAAVSRREIEIKRRGGASAVVRFFDTEYGTLDRMQLDDGAALATRWAGAGEAAASLAGYLTLPLARSVGEGERALRQACAFSLHFVLADKNDVLYCQAGRVPKRAGGWSGLYPVGAAQGAWVGSYEGDGLPRAVPVDDLIASANESRLAPDGTALATLAQPGYRLERIEALLRARRDHDQKSMSAIQLDTLSLQAHRLLPLFLSALPDGRLKTTLVAWNFRCDADSVGAHAFALAYAAARAALRHELGGEWFTTMLARTELSVWWLDAIDRVLADEASWSGARGERLRAALGTVALQEPRAWGEVQRLTLRHLLVGGMPAALGWDRGPFALPGSVATVRQGNLVPQGKGAVAVGPAYRFISDLGTDEAWTSLPGGIDGSRFTRTYDRWLSEWRQGDYHALRPPAAGEHESNE